MKKILLFILLLFFVFPIFGCGEKEKEEVIITKESYELLEGEETTILYEVKNLNKNTTIDVKSLDESICKVENNKIIAIAKGTTKVEIKLSSSETKYTIDVIVNALEKINVLSKEIDLDVDDIKKIDYETLNLKDTTKVIIKSLDESICKIEDDKVKALKAGETKIEIALSSSDVKYEINVKVNPKEELNVISKDMTLEFGESTVLKYATYNLKDDTKVIIESSDDSVIVIDGNNIISKNSGEAIVTFYLSSKPETKYTIKVIVNEKKLPMINITTVERTISMLSSLKLEFDIENSETTEYVIKSSDDTIISVNGNLLNGLKAGKARIRVELLNNPDVYDETEFEVVLDPIAIIDKLHIENVLVQDVVTHGENPKERVQRVLGSVFTYAFKANKIIEEIVPITDSEYNGKTATEDMLVKAESMKLVRSGIKHDELKYIVYHDTGNINPGADAKNHADYMVSSGNKSARARSWHYTVDENVIYHHIPDDEVTWQGDSYDAYAKSIGIETCVNFGSDLYKVWQNTGKLMANLIDKYGLSISSVKQHYEMSGKNCPQTLRTNNLYSYAISLIEGELLVKQLLSDYSISLRSLSPEYLDNTGKVIKQPSETTVLSYEVTVKGRRYNESKVYQSVIQGKDDNTPLSKDESKIQTALEFDSNVGKINKDVTKDDEELIETLVNQYQSFDSETKRLIGAVDYLYALEEKLFKLYDVKSSILINEVYTKSEDGAYKYLQLINVSDQKIDLTGYKIKIKHGQEDVFDLYNLVIANNGYVLIGLGNSILFTSNRIVFTCLPDLVLDINLNEDDFVIQILDNENNVVDMLGVGNVTDYEGESIPNNTQGMSISRKYPIDTNNNLRDFKISNPNPVNMLKQGNTNALLSEDETTMFKMDYLTLQFNVEVTEENCDIIKTIIEDYEKIDENILKYSQTKDLIRRLKISVEAISNPDLKILYEIIQDLPTRIVNDYKFPEVEGVKYYYEEGQDQTYYNIEKGELLKVSHKSKYISFVIEYNNTKLGFTINFGIASDNEKIIYNTGTKKPSGGRTSDGFGTYADQESAIGFGGVAIKVDGKVYFIGKKALINLNSPASGNRLTKKDLRPLGGENMVNNVGLVKGVAREYAGSGALYYNASDKNLIFELSDTYGRNNNGAYGYFKVQFSKNIDGDYVVSKVQPNSGDNNSSNGLLCELKPGDYLWCPHTYETNVEGGTWFMNPAASTSGGVLVEGKTLEIVNFKTFN